ncbi:MAG TPA: glycosyltransferase family 2 protein, partial [Burkholderiaceae bacterium]|nr:glycosyltransferase family 2 protein [Burkholderiaceae bacterium]
MTGKLLTIAIPTYNRAGHLALLLDTLAIEVRGLEASIDVVVLDNASTDRTPEVTAGFVAQCAVGRVVRQATNIGSAPNFVACYRAADSHYFWMIGDDDVPAKGLLAHVVKLLAQDSPDLVYADSKWAEDITPLVADRTVPRLRMRLIDREAFCRRTNVYLTFISS